ncbi:MAG TPA: metallophosphoesterase [Kofleriaceae bacterium]|nr:metallophosphoesterase [Kofleriaceae bacterium]
MRRRFQIALAIYIASHLYIWWRLVLPLPSPSWQLGTALVAVFAPSFPLILRIRSRWKRDAARPWLVTGYLWFGFATYFLLGAFASHVAVAFGVDARTAAQICAAGAVAVVVAGIVNVALGPRVRRVRVPLARLPVASYTIAHLTDVHIGAVIGREFAEQLVQRVNALRPDLIVITGDLVDGSLTELRPHIEPLRQLRARDGVFVVTGNHEYYWNVEPWLAHLRSLGMRVLRNEHVTIADTLVLAGADDASFGEDVPRAVAGRDPQLPLVLLAHHPRTIARAMTAGVDLQLSGHTHGGQLLPFGYLARLWDPKVSGLARFGATWLYVSDGTGFWGPPLRVGTRCEIAAITLRPAG